MSSKTKHRFVSLKTIENDSKATSIWAINNTNPRGIINISMPDGLGGTTIMTIPITWIPVDLTTQATKESLLKSPSFRRLVTAGNIGLIDEEQAEEIMTSEGAKDEATRVYSIVQQVEMVPASNSPEVSKLKSEESGLVSGFAMNIIGMDEVDEDKILSMIKGQEGILTSEDYTYIATNSTQTKVKEYCAAQAVS
jgi:hypothetical protein